MRRRRRRRGETKVGRTKRWRRRRTWKTGDDELSGRESVERGRGKGEGQESDDKEGSFSDHKTVARVTFKHDGQQ